MNEKKIFLVIFLIVIIIVAVIIFNKTRLNKQKNNTIENKLEENKIENNVVENNVVNNGTVNKNETVSVNASNNDKVADPNQEIDKNEMHKQESNKEKAEKLAKQELKQKYNIDAIPNYDYTDENGMYIVIMRDEDTHDIGIKYKVNVSTEKVEEITE